MSSRRQLLIIDAQNDFCHLPADWCAIDPITRLPNRYHAVATSVFVVIPVAVH